jgi:peptide/nickel transport system permease protein
MYQYLARRLILLPITLFSIVLVNFAIINLAPGDPVMVSQIAMQGGARQEDRSVAFGTDDRYLQFREFYGLTLPVLWNTWPFITQQELKKTLWQLIHVKTDPKDTQEMNFKDYEALRVQLGDEARYIMPKLLKVMENPASTPEERGLAVRFFVRGGTRQAILGSGLTDAQWAYNKKIAKDNLLLRTLQIDQGDSQENINEKLEKLRLWYEENKEIYQFEPTTAQKIKIFFFDTRFFRYMSRVVRLDFGTLRNDANKSVVSEVTRRFKYSLTLSILPMIITFISCQFLGLIMALKQNQFTDKGLNLILLVLYAIPIFVVAPFLIEKIALNNYFPFTHIPIPLGGFTSPDIVYAQQTSIQRLFDILQHICLPLIAIIYGTLAAQARLSRTAVLEVLHQDYVRTARAKGVAPFTILWKHVGRNAAITIVTSIAGSLGIVLGGSLIVETLFEINGFGKFFYEAVLNRDYNVIMFSALAGSFLTLLGYLVADIAYTILDPRVSLD